ncbi:MAG: lysylphosphatidylglycerol synthase transmembrane domain-containing protein [Vicinamibacterales bacterium]|nr:lysylphosphatidylglycerol synthase transmembrane domain-containing protein [Vicinamibacterales bacterium]
MSGPAPSTRRPPPWRVVLAFAIGIVLLALAVRQVDWAQVLQALRGVSPLWLVGGAAGFAATHVMLALRWRALVESDEPIPVADAFDFVMIGAAAGLVLPARLNDVARAVAAGRYHALSASRLLGTIVVERLLDVVAILGFGVALSALMRIPPFVQGALTTLFAAAVAATVVLWLGENGPLGMIARGVARWRGPLSRTLPVFMRFLAGVGVMRQPRRLPVALGAAIGAWLCSAVAATCNVAAFGFDVPWYAGAFVVLVINLGGIIPAPPAGVGVYHYLAMLALSPWVEDSSAAFAFALVAHASSFASTLVLGSASLARKGMSLAGLRRMAAAGADAADGRHG